MGDVGFMERLFGKFQLKMVDGVKEIERSVTARDAAETARLAHSLEGRAANLSAVPLRDVAAGLEDLGRQDTLAGCEELVARLRVELDRCVAYLPAAAAEAAAKKGAAK